MGSHDQHPLLRVISAMDADPDGFASDVYFRLWSIDPGLRDLFPASMTHQREVLVRALRYVFRSIAEQPDHTALLEFLSQLGRDHRKFGVVDVHYRQFYTALMGAIEHAMGPSWDEEIEAVVTHALMLTTGVMSGAAQSAPGPAVWHAKVVAKYPVSRGQAVVQLLADRPLTYRPGQSLEVQVPQNPRIWRLLSPATPSNPQRELEFHVRAVDAGVVSSSIVRSTAVGDVWTLAQGHGSMSVQTTDDVDYAGNPIPNSRRDVLMVAGGTGIAPMRSLILELSKRGDGPRVHLFYGARYPGELYDTPTLARIASVNPWLRVTLVAEEQTDPWWLEGLTDVDRYRFRRIHGQLIDAVLNTGDWSNHQVLLAGSPKMIERTKQGLILAGVRGSFIQHDPY